MPITLDKFILNLAEKAGIDPTDKRLGELFAHTEINKINVNQELVNDIGESLISVSDATNNHPKIKTHYFAEVMSNVDRVLDDVYKTNEFTDEEIAELKKERSSTKRISLVTAKLKEKLQAASEAANKGGDAKDKDITKLKQQIDTLNQELATAKKSVADKEAEFNGRINEFKKNHAVSELIAGQKTVFDAMPVEAKNAALRTLIDKKLQDNKVEFYIDDNGKVSLRMVEGGANYFDKQNKQITATDFISSVLAEAKVLQQSNNGANNGGKPNPAQPQNNGSGTQVVSGQPAKGDNPMKALIAESEKDFATQNPMEIVTGSVT